MELRIAGIIRQSVVDGPGIRFVVFAQGCKHNCKGCHNPQTHSLEGGYNAQIKDIINEVKKDPLIYGVTFSGGEPFLQADKFAYLAKELKTLGLNIITYTGYTIDELLLLKENPGITDLLMNTDILIDGKFIMEKKSLLLKFRGSTNQRIINSRESLKRNKAIELDDFIFLGE